MVTWDQIVAECDGYRAGFVAVFRKYEGEPTDERDAYNRVVKVTAPSFARHAGIADATFRDWLREKGASPARISTPGRARSDLKRAMEGMEPEEIIREVAKVAPRAVENVYYEGTEVPGRETLTKTASSIGDADRITGPLAHILNVLWKEAQRIASVPTPRKAEREALIEAAGDLRVYADEFESLGHEEISTEDLADRLREQNR